MRVAHELGMLLGDYLDRVTHLEHEMWCVWLNRQWDQPDRHDWYTMALTAEVRQFRYGWSYKSPPVVSPKDAQLRFETIEGQPVDDRYHDSVPKDEEGGVDDDKT